MCEPTTRFHEHPSQRLARLAERIAATRGSPIETFGTTDLMRYDPPGERKVLMQADQILYLHPLEYDVWTRDVDIGSSERPEVVLEVDYSTDVGGGSSGSTRRGAFRKSGWTCRTRRRRAGRSPAALA